MKIFAQFGFDLRKGATVILMPLIKKPAGQDGYRIRMVREGLNGHALS
jgi:hypothetical protein